MAPPAWNGKDPLPLVMFIHGWHSSSAEVVADHALVASVTGAGALLVAPDGRNQTWAHVGSPSQARDDLTFLRAVLADAEARWPVDRRLVIAAGFSQGGSMVWDLACYAPGLFTAFLPVSGAFWEPLPAKCSAGPVELRHVHGRNDGTVPMAGRAIGGRFRQGNIGAGFRIWQATNGCAAEPDSVTRADDLDCETWSRCSSGAQLALCLHDGDHVMTARWLADGIAWAKRRTAERGGN